jgi:hypothetical protein
MFWLFDAAHSRESIMLNKSMFVVTRLLFVFVLSFVGIASASAQATRTWVSGVGDDANPCSRTAPCKTFAGAISKTTAGGEMDCLDPGGFGTLTITKAITIDCSGTFGSVLASGTSGITVNAGTNDKVVLRGLSINGAGTGINGIALMQGLQLTIERCIITGFTNNAVNINTSTTSEVYVTNSYITSSNKGIVATTTTTSGIVIVVVNNTDIINVGLNAFEAAGGPVVGTLTNSRLTSANAGVNASASGAQLNVDTSSLVNNNNAFAVASGSTIRVSNSNIYNNGTNFNITAGGSVLSAGNNRTTPGGTTNPSGSITLQ